ncbi:Cytoplasmic dynein 2 heavy chain 1 [Lamellibrachia satsuma]|nr:Cytoplasmic dynein 2 heavy chain 1 [Lamellibrachia satsuma]
MTLNSVTFCVAEIQSWIVCDGDIDPEWIESLNSVLDDNRLLTMPSGERIQFGPNVNFVFETHDLSCASPATISRMGMIFLSDENTDVKALVASWLSKQEENERVMLSGWVEDYFYRALELVLRQTDFVVDTSLVGMVMNGLSHLKNVGTKAQFAVCLIRGLGGNLSEASRENLAKEVYSLVGEMAPDPHNPLNTRYDADTGRLTTYTDQLPTDLSGDTLGSGGSLPVIETAEVRRVLDYFATWLEPDNKQPFILVGPEGCGKGMLLRHCFEQLRSTQVATIHCSAQTNPSHVLQKLNQMCMVISTNTGRVYRPKDCERLILYLKDLNLPKPDKWGTSELIAFLQQVLTYNGFYDNNLEFVGLEGVQVMASMNAGSSLGRHTLTSRFTSVVRICFVGYPSHDQLELIYLYYLAPVLQRQLGRHPVWSNQSKVRRLASSMVQVYNQLRAEFSVDDYSHYLFTPRDLTRWVLSLLRYDLKDTDSDSSSDQVLEVWAYEANRLFRDKLVSQDSMRRFDNILQSVIQAEWSSRALDKLLGSYYVTWGARADASAPSSVPGAPLPAHGKPLGKLNTDDLNTVIEKGLLQYSKSHLTYRNFM